MKEINKMLGWLHQKVISNRRTRENQVLINFFSQHVKSDASILDVGCGLGHNLTLLKNNGYVNAVGTDISEKMLASSKERGHITNGTKLSWYFFCFIIILISLLY
jgi:ubiquinone/menaquinone biosynthesis C-methylase UbiE